jgi:hypothetical protein
MVICGRCHRRERERERDREREREREREKERERERAREREREKEKEKERERRREAEKRAVYDVVVPTKVLSTLTSDYLDLRLRHPSLYIPKDLERVDRSYMLSCPPHARVPLLLEAAFIIINEEEVCTLQ